MAFIPTTSLSSLAINKCVRITTALPFTLFAVPITQERPQTTCSPRSESRDTSSPPPRAKPQAPKHSKQADFTRLSGLFIGTVEYQVEGSFVVLMWALLLRCATSQVTGILG